MTVIHEFVAANRAYAKDFANINKGGLPMPPGRIVTLVTCMDARIVPSKILGLEEGDAHVIRNAGGLAKDAIRSIIISEQLLGTQEIVLLHHTDCGMLTFTQSQAEDLIQSNLGLNASHVDFQPFSNLVESVKADLAILRAEPLIPESIALWGGYYEVETGKIVQVEE